jgi:poly-beta-hydroxybutyrate-responsive repressor
MDIAAAPSQLPRHYLQACLLLLIDGRSLYGYSLREPLLELGVGQRDWGQLYRTLRAMEGRGLLLSCWENSESGPSRRTYHVTDRGREQLRAWAQGLAATQDIVGEFLARYDDGRRPAPTILDWTRSLTCSS